ncbi:MAG: hydroxyacylglutathione hydrolase [Myxococcales bacterium]|nr:hydroxyacylglutathione hydrolase [Myxococcales bacterium]MCB9668827.1 hydroxyacylglutathione hydrolase [Alphaproteobacteria bacterium]MCB9691374.1 hydroxyacylglutathione hydrolase [Alphaproteobacteria bacterium]
MQHDVTAIDGPWTLLDGRAEVHMVPVAKDNLVWVVVCTTTREAAVVDGPPDASGVLELCERIGARLTTVWNTHTHWDHIGINQDLGKRGLLAGMAVFGPARKAADVPGLTHPVDDGDTARVGEVVADVWLTEGHIDGHVSYVLDGAVLCGDTLFAGGCGYLFDGPPAKMYASLLRLASLPPSTLVFCAHEYTLDNLAFATFIEPGSDALTERVARDRAVRAEGRATVPSTIALERATNPFLRPGAPALVARVAELGGDVSSPGAVFASTRELKNRGLHKG